MEKFVALFEHAKPYHLLIWIAIWMLIFGLLENVVPNFSFKYNRKRHAGVNLSFLITTAIVNIAIGIITAGAYLLIQEHKIGLIYWVEMPLWVQLIVCLLLLDFIGMYCSHYVLHRFKWFWKFHMVHHSDTHVDVTTGTRHHPGDWFLREMFALVAVFLTGAPVA